MIQWDINGIYPLVNVDIAIENGQRNSGFTHCFNGGSFQFVFLLMFTRGYSTRSFGEVKDGKRKSDSTYPLVN